MKDTRQYKVIILDGKETPYETHYPTGVESLINFIRDCCERYRMEDSDPDPDTPFILRIERIPESEVVDFERKFVESVMS